MAYKRFSCWQKIARGFAAAAWLSGCATVNVPSVGQQGYAVEDDERRLMKRADEASEMLDDRGYVYPDEELGAYLNGLAGELLPDDLKNTDFQVRVKLIRDPSLNAFAMPNGGIYICTGILAAADNEAQVATLLAHEMTHVISRHALKQFRSVTNTAAFWSAMAAPLAIAGGNLGLMVAQLSLVSSVSGYSQDLEFEADEMGFDRVKAAGYNVRETVKLFEHLRDFIKAEDIKEPFFFSSHPRIIERIRNFESLIMKSGGAAAEGRTGEDEFNRLTRALLLDDITLCLERGMFKTAERNADKFVRLYPEAPEGYHYRGETFRQRQDAPKGKKLRDKTDDYPKAVEGFDQALIKDPHFAPALKGKARTLLQDGNKDEAKVYFRKYLDALPQAEDRVYIEQILNKP
ncbi:MAG: M48 family metalloprotease [Candidatus Omnitrophota bacterium]|nr:M48 family metalloprotease [Candidatus Omnitrophota bacterium]MDZ4242353.1 M48 family metalloprotease [Candidatus Omnitrophota bacterium]